MRINLTVNITKRCNTVCAHCNRGVGTVDWSDVRDMTVEDAERLAGQIKQSGVKVRKIHFSGGEPSIHKNIHDVVKAFTSVCDWLMVISNGLVPRRKLAKLPKGVKWRRDFIDEKKHHPFFVSPTDLGIENKIKMPLSRCGSIAYAGSGVEPEGFMQCGLARTITRALGRSEEGLFHDSPYTGEPDYEICRHCPLSLGSKGNKKLSLEVAKGMHECPTESFVGLKRDYKILEPADAHLRILAGRNAITYDTETGLVTDCDDTGRKLHQLS